MNKVTSKIFLTFYSFMNLDVFTMCIIVWINHRKKDELYGLQKLLYCTVCSYIYKRANVRYKMFTVILDEKPLTIQTTNNKLNELNQSNFHITNYFIAGCS